MGQSGGAGVYTAVKSRDCKVDVVLHGVVADAIAIRHNWAETHHAVGLSWDLDGEGENKERKHRSTMLRTM